tara:strand:- start:91 stop:324 length:234 start_codon:yes stop_codon:yes gene_type:complete
MYSKGEFKLTNKQKNLLRETLNLKDWEQIAKKTGWSKHTLLAGLYGNIKIASDKKDAFDMAKEIAVNKAKNVINFLS